MLLKKGKKNISFSRNDELIMNNNKITDTLIVYLLIPQDTVII